MRPPGIHCRTTSAGSQSGSELRAPTLPRGGTFKATLRDVLAGDNGRVVGVHRGTGERDGKHLEIDCCLVFEMKDGRVVDGREYLFDLYAWDEFWS